jgi:hypothetical protein
MGRKPERPKDGPIIVRDVDTPEPEPARWTDDAESAELSGFPIGTEHVIDQERRTDTVTTPDGATWTRRLRYSWDTPTWEDAAAADAAARERAVRAAEKRNRARTPKRLPYVWKLARKLVDKHAEAKASDRTKLKDGTAGELFGKIPSDPDAPAAIVHRVTVTDEDGNTITIERHSVYRDGKKVIQREELKTDRRETTNERSIAFRTWHRYVKEAWEEALEVAEGDTDGDTGATPTSSR